MICSICSIVFVLCLFMGISVISSLATVTISAVRVFIYGPLPHHFPSTFCLQFFLKVQNATFIKKLRFEFTKRKTGLSFFEKALFGLQMLNQTGTKCVCFYTNGKIKIILLFNLFLLLFMGLTVFFLVLFMNPVVLFQLIFTFNNNLSFSIK